MTKKTNPTAIPAKHGEKMIEVRVRFFTDQIAGKKNYIIPKHAWDSGFVDMANNKTHGITAATPQPFNSILDLQSVVAKVLVEHAVTLHANTKLGKLIQP